MALEITSDDVVEDVQVSPTTVPVAAKADKTDISFSIKHRKPVEITFKIGGRVDSETGEEDTYVYHFTPPKQSVMAMPILSAPRDRDEEAAMLRGQLDWLSFGLPDHEAERIKTRLASPRDDLDLEDLMGITQTLASRVANRPTT